MKNGLFVAKYVLSTKV